MLVKASFEVLHNTCSKCIIITENGRYTFSEQVVGSSNSCCFKANKSFHMLEILYLKYILTTHANNVKYIV